MGKFNIAEFNCSELWICCTYERLRINCTRKKDSALTKKDEDRGAD
jgi:hypothetical protein